MKRSYKVAMVAAATLLVALPLQAQRAGASRVIRGEASGTLAHDPDVLPQTVTFGQLIAAINGQPGHVARLKGMTDLQTSGVRLVNVAGLMVGNNQQALQNALERNSRSVTDMRTAVDASPVITGMLSERELTSANVIAVDVAANGTVWVFFRQ